MIVTICESFKEQNSEVEEIKQLIECDEVSIIRNTRSIRLMFRKSGNTFDSIERSQMKAYITENGRTIDRIEFDGRGTTKQ